MATDKVAHWLDIADEDLGVAEDLYTFRHAIPKTRKTCIARLPRRLAKN